MRDLRFAHARLGEQPIRPTQRELYAARAAAHELVSGIADVARLNASRKALEEQGSSTWRPFHDEFIRMLRMDAELRAAWVAQIGADVLEQYRDPGQRAIGAQERNELRAAIEDWQSEIDLFSVWGH